MSDKKSTGPVKINVEGMGDLEFEDLRRNFEPILGFLKKPHKNNVTPVDFVGILRDVVPFKDDRGKDTEFYVFVSTSDQPKTFYVTEDDETLPVKKGDRIGVSGSGAIKGLKDKKNHVAILHYTGEKISTKNGDMWVVDTKISKTPLAPETDDKIPF